MNILITVRKTQNMAVYFPPAVMEQIEALGKVSVLNLSEHWTEQDLIESVGEADVCMTHWGCPCFTPAVLDRAPRLKMIAHCTGSVASLVSDAVYDRGIKVCSANNVMARFVAEGALAYIMDGLHRVAMHNTWMKQGELWKHKDDGAMSLFGAKVGMVGLGAVGTNLLEMLQPFGVTVRLYDPYVNAEALLAKHPNLSIHPLDEVLTWADIVTLHASLTQETRGMVGAARLALIRDGALLVNTARGAIIDEAALAAELATGRFFAVLDVYEHEPLGLESPLRSMDNVTLMPHMAGLPARENMTEAMVEEVRRFADGQPLKYEIPYQRYKLMTKES